MLKSFSVENFKGFRDKITFNLGSPCNYNFNQEVICDGCVTKGILFGVNSSGKSNLGLALLDLVCHLTDNQTLPDNYYPYRNLESSKSIAEFEYVFTFRGKELIYQYGKSDIDKLEYEKLSISGREVIYYDYLRNEGFTRLKGAETLNQMIAVKSAISRVKYVSSNAILAENEENAVFYDFMHYVNHMLLFYSLDTRGYEGFRSGKGSIAEGILESGKLLDFQHFLKENGIVYELVKAETNGKKTILCRYGDEFVDFFAVASTGTRALALFYYWYIVMHDASLVYIDEFDAFYHFELANNIIRRLKEIKGVQVFATSHNTDLMSNDLLRPDCYFLIKGNGIVSMSNATDKELRRAHNLQKMYKAGAFDEG